MIKRLSLSIVFLIQFLFVGCEKTQEEQLLISQIDTLVKQCIDRRLAKQIELNPNNTVFKRGDSGIIIITDGIPSYEIIGDNRCRFFRRYDAFEVVYSKKSVKHKFRKKSNKFSAQLACSLLETTKEYRDARGVVMQIVIPPQYRKSESDRNKYAESVTRKYCSLLPEREFDFEYLLADCSQTGAVNVFDTLKCSYDQVEKEWSFDKSVQIAPLQEFDFGKYGTQKLSGIFAAKDFVFHNGVYCLEKQIEEIEKIEKGLIYFNGNYITPEEYASEMNVAKRLEVFKADKNFTNAKLLMTAVAKSDNVSSSTRREIYDLVEANMPVIFEKYEFRALIAIKQELQSDDVWMAVSRAKLEQKLDEKISRVARDLYEMSLTWEQVIRGLSLENHITGSNVLYAKKMFSYNYEFVNRFLAVRAWFLPNREKLLVGIPQEHYISLLKEFRKKCYVCRKNDKMICTACHGTRICRTCNGNGSYEVPMATGGVVTNECSPRCQACPRDIRCVNCNSTGFVTQYNKWNKVVAREYKSALKAIKDTQKELEQYK